MTVRPIKAQPFICSKFL
uniref:Uncharacterized protein n=1 Tax=Lepeophtheirus salmonis TaxID=72036 RepID=A0A0K2TL43_LEPSM